MNDPDLQPQSVPLAHKDRKVGLVIFGVLTAAAGFLALLMAALIIVTLTFVRNRPDLPATTAPVISVGVYAAAGIGLIWLGIGSIIAKRWARALLTVLSWSALVLGIWSAGFLLAMRSRLIDVIRATHPPNQPELPPGTEATLFAMILGMMLVFYILLPLVWALFYSGKNAKATCEARDPKVRWTDRCPLPVLAVVIWVLLGAASMIAVAIWRPVAPMFGVLLTGPVASVVLLLVALIWAYGAWSLYRLNIIGWWLLVLTFLLLSVSSFITYSHVPIEEVYRRMNYPPEQIALVSKLMPPQTLHWISSIFVVPFLAYLLYLRRFLAARTNHGVSAA